MKDYKTIKNLLMRWIPAFAGMTTRGAGMTTRGAGMTTRGAGMTTKRQ